MQNKYPSEMSRRDAEARALARALIRRPKILILDEPTTGLDPSRTGAIHELIRRTQQKFGLSAVLVSHDVPKVFEISDRLAFMHEGKMRLYGTVEQVTGAKDAVFEHFLAGKTGYDSEDALAKRA